MLGAASYRLDRRPGETGGETAAGGAAENVIVGKSGSEDTAPDEFGREVADYGFDFREFGHKRNLAAAATESRRWGPSIGPRVAREHNGERVDIRPGGVS